MPLYDLKSHVITISIGVYTSKDSELSQTLNAWGAYLKAIMPLCKIGSDHVKLVYVRIYDNLLYPAMAR